MSTQERNDLRQRMQVQMKEQLYAKNISINILT